jgi:hypothetical protein
MKKSVHNKSGHFIAFYENATILTDVPFLERKWIPVISTTDFSADYSMSYNFVFFNQYDEQQLGDATYCDISFLGSTLKDMLSGKIPLNQKLDFFKKSGAKGRFCVLAKLQKIYYTNNFYNHSTYDYPVKRFGSFEQSYFMNFDEYHKIQKNTKLSHNYVLAYPNFSATFLYEITDDKKTIQQYVDDIFKKIHKDIKHDEQILVNNESPLVQQLILNFKDDSDE